MMKFHCLFEQSGTFRDVFRSYGHEAYCYDIQNEYGKTDYQIDLFKEIENAFAKITNPYGLTNLDSECGITTIFDDMKPETDFIMAFFPCTYFTDTNELQFKLWNGGKRLPYDKKNISRILERTKNRAYFFEMWTKFCFVCQELGIRTIIENPAAGNKNYIKMYSCYEPQFTDRDRTEFGDCFKKPTHYWGINFELKENFMMFNLNPNRKGIRSRTVENVGRNCKERSEITPRYANNFYKRFIQEQIKER